MLIPETRRRALTNSEAQLVLQNPGQGWDVETLVEAREVRDRLEILSYDESITSLEDTSRGVVDPNRRGKRRKWPTGLVVAGVTKRIMRNGVPVKTDLAISNGTDDFVWERIVTLGLGAVDEDGLQKIIAGITFTASEARTVAQSLFAAADLIESSSELPIKSCTSRPAGKWMI